MPRIELFVQYKSDKFIIITEKARQSEFFKSVPLKTTFNITLMHFFLLQFFEVDARKMTVLVILTLISIVVYASAGKKKIFNFEF